MMNLEVDEKAVERLIKKIVIEEGRNLKTKDKTDAQMISLIKKKIEEEVQCLLNQ